MLKRFDESELLALIEDRLDPARAVELRAELAREPAALARIEAMRSDRAALMSVREPIWPLDLASDIDRLVARPLLVETSAEQWRRQHQRRHGGRWAMAAAAAVALGVGAWMWTSPSGRVTENPHPEGSAPEGMLAGPALSGTGVAHPASETAAGEPHSASNRTMEPRGPSGALAAGGGQPVSPSAPLGRRDGASLASAPTIAAPFALVIRSSEHDRAIEALREIAREMSGGAALVKNLTLREVQELDRIRLAAAGDSTPLVRADAAERKGSHTMEGATGAPEKRGMLGAPAPLKSRSPRGSEGADSSASSGLLEGARGLGASLEQQLVNSDSGAELTLSVQLEQLQHVLERLQLSQGQSTVLRALRASQPESPAVGDLRVKPAGADWLVQLGLVQAATDQLRQADPRSIVLLPVVIEPPVDGRPTVR